MVQTSTFWSLQKKNLFRCATTATTIKVKLQTSWEMLTLQIRHSRLTADSLPPPANKRRMTMYQAELMKPNTAELSYERVIRDGVGFGIMFLSPHFWSLLPGFLALFSSGDRPDNKLTGFLLFMSDNVLLYSLEICMVMKMRSRMSTRLWCFLRWVMRKI